MKEAAIIQTFPENFEFATDRMEAVCDMIGNAVPPEFARIAAERIIEALRARSRHGKVARR